MSIPEHRTPRDPKRLLRRGEVFLAAGMLLFCCGCSTVHPVTYPGKLVRTRVLDVTEQRTIRPELVSADDGVVRIRLTDVRIRTIREIPLHEKVLHYVSDDDPTKRPVRIEVVPGEFVEGSERTRKETADAGPLARVAVEINGEAASTNGDGVYVDAADRILSLFDVPARRSATVVITSNGYEPASLRITRNDLLRSLGIDPVIVGRSGTNAGLKSAARAPGFVVQGQHFDLVVDVVNSAPEAVWGVEGRLFSRHAWLDGRNFYFGRIDPGKKRSFRRRITVPGGAPPGVYYAVIGFWDWLGPVPSIRIPLRICVERASPPSPPPEGDR